MVTATGERISANIRIDYWFSHMDPHFWYDQLVIYRGGEGTYVIERWELDSYLTENTYVIGRLIGRGAVSLVLFGLGTFIMSDVKQTDFLIMELEDRMRNMLQAEVDWRFEN